MCAHANQQTNQPPAVEYEQTSGRCFSTNAGWNEIIVILNPLFRVQRSSGGRCMGPLGHQPGTARRQESDLASDAQVLFLLYPRPFGTSPWAGHTDEVTRRGVRSKKDINTSEEGTNHRKTTLTNTDTKNTEPPERDGPTGAQLYSHSGPLFIYWSLSSLFY
ncbi:hypothetical protein T08_6471 [Trichinella sp. T8]|nr:hypothetical protein T08_6471 [Trichinella sp. T8]